jgi:glycosyltransferase involved in cell wall biosynthesis
LIRYSLVIPCYNEALSLHQLVARCAQVLAREDVEIVLVNNGSTDDSREVFGQLEKAGIPENLRFIHAENNLGYGGGILHGLEHCKGEFLGWTHADLQTDPADLIKAIAIVEGSPSGLFIKGRRVGRPMADSLFTIGMSVYEALFLKAKLWDINAQPTLFPRGFYLNIRMSAPSDFSLDLFFYYRAKLAGLTIKRFKVRFEARQHGESSWNVDWSSKKRFILRTIEFSKNLKKSQGK